jgi:hypothetical protein
MAITASIEGDPTMVYRAICHGLLTASVLPLAELPDDRRAFAAISRTAQFKIHKV